MSGDHSKYGGLLSWGCRVTVLVMVGDYLGDVVHHPGQTWKKLQVVLADILSEIPYFCLRIDEAELRMEN